MTRENVVIEWFPWYPTLYRADTADLTLAEDGAYRRLIDEYMVTRRPLPDNDQALARITGVSLAEWLDLSSRLRHFFTANNRTLHHKRCDIELDRQDRHTRLRTEVGKKGAEARWSNINDINALGMPGASMTHADGISQPTRDEYPQEKKGHQGFVVHRTVNKFNDLDASGMPKAMPSDATRQEKRGERKKDPPLIAPPKGGRSEENTGPFDVELETLPKNPNIRDNPKTTAKRKPPSKPGTRLPEDWKPNEEEIAYALTLGFTQPEIDDIAFEFRNYWTNGAGRTKTHVNWTMAWQVWCRRNRDHPGGSHAAPRQRGSLSDAVRVVMGTIRDDADR